MTIGKKLGICSATLMAISAIMGGAGWYYVSALGDRLDQAVGSTAKKIELAGDLKEHVYAFRLQERGILLFSHINAADQVENCKQLFSKEIEGALSTAAGIRPLLVTEAGRQVIAEIETAIQDYRNTQTEVPHLISQGKLAEATAWDKEKIVPIGGRIVKHITHYEELLTALNRKLTAEALSQRAMAKAVLSLGLLASLGVNVLVGFVLLASTRRLRTATLSLGQGAGQLAEAAGQISASSQLLSQGATEQAASLEQTSASSSEINAMVRANVESARQAAEMVDQSASDFHRAIQALDESVRAMAEMKTSSGKISSIIKVIDEIAFQTNILALNAAVEAARAGEAGMGFAVVADEVRNLAHRCSEAARETSALIADSISKSGDGANRVDQVVEIIRNVAAQAAKVKTHVDEVHAASGDQARGIDQISRAIAEMERVTQTNAASAEQTAATAATLNAEAGTMRRAIDELTSLVG
jgi:methyl-accepting chemotaxis protein/methyl-accepting chemotaxis protein-1 (serine sensor receptor)